MITITVTAMVIKSTMVMIKAKGYCNDNVDGNNNANVHGYG